MTSISDKITAIKAAHILAIAASLADPEPVISRPRLGMRKTHIYSAKQWAAMRRRRKQAHAARRRNRR